LDAQGGLLAPEATATAFLLRSRRPQLNKELVIERPDRKGVTLKTESVLMMRWQGMIGWLEPVMSIAYPSPTSGFTIRRELERNEQRP
jgi:hypothetical protein